MLTIKSNKYMKLKTKNSLMIVIAMFICSGILSLAEAQEVKQQELQIEIKNNIKYNIDLWVGTASYAWSPEHIKTWAGQPENMTITVEGLPTFISLWTGGEYTFIISSTGKEDLHEFRPTVLRGTIIKGDEVLGDFTVYAKIKKQSPQKYILSITIDSKDPDIKFGAKNKDELK